MSALPEGWVETTLGEVVELRGEKAAPSSVPDAPFIGLEDIEPHTSRILKIGKGSDVKSSVAKFFKGDVLYSRLRPYLNKVVTADFDGIASAEILVLKSTSATNAEFVRRRVMSPEFLDFSAMLDKGDRPRVNFPEISRFTVALPPLPEQQRIVAKVDALMTRTARARKDLAHIPTLITRYKQRLLALAFSGELTADWRVKAELSPPTVVTLVDVAKGFSYGSSTKSAPSGNVPVLRMGNIQDGKLDWKNLVFTSDPVEIKKYTLVAGDVLFNRTNSPELVGKTALYKGEQPSIYAGYLIRIQCTDRLMPEYLTYCLNSPSGRSYCWEVKTDGVSQSNINAKKIAAFTFLLPTLPEQTEIVRRIETAFAWLDRLAAEHSSATKLLPKLDAAILTKAFAGQLVPQNPTDEPASVLLARVKAERDAVPVKGRGRKVMDNPKTNTSAPPPKLRKPRQTSKAKSMSKSRTDEDVMGKPYLATLLRESEAMSPRDLFRASDLSIADFYKQLAWEIHAKHIVDDTTELRAA